MAAIIATQTDKKPVGQIFLTDGTGVRYSIKLAYVGSTLVFNGQR